MERVIDAEYVEVKTNKEKMLKKWWNRMFLKMLFVLVAVAFTVCVLGVLAIPVVMAYFFSPMWILLYAAYLLVLMLFITIGK